MDEEVPEIDIAVLATRREQGVKVLDVRELDEWQEARIPGVVHIPLTDLVERVSELPTDEPLLVVCAVGGRSRNACTYLRGLGIDATNVDGGTKGWIEAGFDVERS